MKNGRRGNRFGIFGVILTGTFWACAEFAHPTSVAQNHYVVYVIFPALLVTATICIVAAAVRASKWWLVALLGPTYGALLLLSLRA